MNVASVVITAPTLVGSLLKIVSQTRKDEIGKLRLHAGDRDIEGAHEVVKCLSMLEDSYGRLNLETLGEARKKFAVQRMANLFRKMCVASGTDVEPEFVTPVLTALFDAPAHSNPEIQLCFLNAVADEMCSNLAPRLRAVARAQELTPGVPRINWEFTRREDGLYFSPSTRFAGASVKIVDVRLPNSTRPAANNGQQCFFFNEQAQAIRDSLEGVMAELEGGTVLQKLLAERNTAGQVKAICERLLGTLQPVELELLRKHSALTNKHFGAQLKRAEAN